VGVVTVAHRGKVGGKQAGQWRSADVATPGLETTTVAVAAARVGGRSARAG
jgi:hypothetical protein